MMPIHSLGGRVGLSAAIAFLAWLCFMGRPINYEKSREYLQILVQQQEAYVKLKRDLLQSRYEAISSYDTLNQEIQILKQLHQNLQSVPEFIDTRGHTELHQMLMENQALLEEKEEMIRLFKSDNVILQNSLQYLPILSEEVANHLRQDQSEIAQQMNQNLDQVLHNALIYNLFTNTQMEEKLRESIHQLQTLHEEVILNHHLYIQHSTTQTKQLDYQELVDSVIQHAQMVLNCKLNIDQRLYTLLSMPTDSLSETMEVTYSRYVQATIQTRRWYQFAALTWVIGVSGWMAFQVIRHLKRANLRTLNILESIADAFIAVDSYGKITYANPQAALLLGCPLNYLLQHDFLEIFPAPEELKCRFSEPVRSNTDCTATEFFDSKSERWFEVRAYAQQKGFSVFLQDISERKQAEMAMQEMNQQLETKVQERTAQLAASIDAAENARQRAESANRAKSIFLSNMSHEFRTPLNVILGFTQVLERRQTLQTRDREHLDIISRSGEHLLNLINDVLEVSKIEAGRADFQPESFDLSQFLQELINLLMLQATRKHLNLQLEQSSSLPQYINTDVSKLRQVLLNLVGNAIKFTEHGSVILNVDVDRQSSLQEDVSTHKQWLSFSIEDTGPGICSEDIESLFEPFVQTKVGRNHQGTGLGLPLSKQFVQLMGGILQVESQIGQGSCFNFKIPVQRVSAHDIESETSQSRVVSLAPGQPHYRFLIVDDRLENRQVLREILSVLDVDFEEANEGAAAIALWQTWQPDLIWMDMRMPGMDGYQATRVIRDCEARLSGSDLFDYHPVIIVAVTASAFESDRARVLASGCDDFVRKPFRTEEIFDRIAKHLGAEFVCTDDNSVTSSSTRTHHQNDIFDVKPDALAQQPAHWQKQFYIAVNHADNDEMLTLISQIQDENPLLAQQLTHLVKSFHLEKLIELTQAIQSA